MQTFCGRAPLHGLIGMDVVSRFCSRTGSASAVSGRVTGQPEVTFSRGLRRRCPEVGLGEARCCRMPVQLRVPRSPFLANFQFGRHTGRNATWHPFSRLREVGFEEISRRSPRSPYPGSWPRHTARGAATPFAYRLTPPWLSTSSSGTLYGDPSGALIGGVRAVVKALRIKPSQRCCCCAIRP